MRNRTLIQATQRREASSEELQSQLALELILNVYAVVGSLILIRCLLLLLQVGDRIWIGRTVYKFSHPFVLPFTLLPGSSRVIIGDLTVGDLTLLAIVIMFPLGVYAYGTRRKRA
jgi:hypothetical protein